MACSFGAMNASPALSVNSMSQLTHIKTNQRGHLLYDDAVVLLGHTGAVLTSKFSLDGTCIVSGGMDRTIRLWHLPQNEFESTPNFGVLEGHKSAVTSMQWKDMETLFSVSADRTIGFWDTITGDRISNGIGHELSVNDCSVSYSATSISVGDDGMLMSWDGRVKKATSSITTLFPLLCCELSKDGSIAYVSGIDPCVKAYDMSNGELLWSCQVAQDTVTGLALSSDGSRLACRLVDGHVVTINASKSVPTGISRVGPSFEGATPRPLRNIVRTCFSTDDVFLTAGSDCQEALVWDSASRRMRARYTDHKDAVLQTDFHPSESILMSCAIDGNIVVRQCDFKT
ncbi:hypothetical protein PUMCH_000271 [Australozyma saopauloensis]|uniref:Uncharacterized protein n=1 Tax=Australozyma saopauloensis TaxID=291208 RepID=A0AAX4H3J4_9ASCO|nr:hypothetical protein PUMCH_000271 [[Candida] saopauloensis]